MPPKKEDSYFYNIKLLNVLFAVSAAVFMGMVMWTVLDDANREWKHWQRKFQKVQYQKTKGEIAAAKKNIDVARYKEFVRLLRKAEEEQRHREGEILKVQRVLDETSGKYNVLNSECQIIKSHYDTAKYRYEEALHKAGGRDAGPGAKEKAAMDSLGKRIAQCNEKLKVMEQQRGKLEEELAAIKAGEQTARDQIHAQRKEIDALNKKLKKVKPGLINQLRDIPILDFMAPNLRIQQVLPEGLTDDYNFSKVPKVDRCITCHVAIDKPGFEEAKQPFTAHPQLELFLGSGSPHPMDRYGCTSCHLGNGRGTSFATAAHTPDSPEQAKLWAKKYHWHPSKHWSWPMLAKSQVQASCVGCHTGVLEVPKADKLNAARNLFSDMGCVGCHATEGFNDQRKAGPSLLHIAGKVDKDWLAAWIENPKSFNPHTRMPRFFGLSNAPMDSRQQAIVGSIAAYLWDESTPQDLLSDTAKGSAKRGKELVEKVGCLGCHSVGDMKASDHGPNLSFTASKLSRKWLVSWLKDPKRMYPQTKMPNLRLTDQEAADIAQYLLTLKNPAFEKQPLPKVQPAALDALVLEELAKKNTKKDAEAMLAGMTAKQKELLVGKQMILFYGCFGCHDIAGFEDTKKTGTELTEEGSKGVEKFDFGFVPITHTREAFFRQKLSDPRAFDMGKVKAPQEKLKMPQFDLTPEQIELLTLHLNSLTKNSVPMERRKILSEDEQWAEKGKHLVQNFNCRGCHVIHGAGGDIAATLSDKGLAPPSLQGEGKKVQGDWLYTFLKKPSTIRPWLGIRMPTFGFDDDQATLMVRHFEAADHVPPSYRSLEPIPADHKQWQAGKEMFVKLQCLQCHQAAAASNKSPSDLAPELSIAGNRLRHDWIVEWLKDPQLVQEGTRMPTFFPEGQSPLPNVMGGDVEAQIEALKAFVVDYKTPEKQ